MSEMEQASRDHAVSLLRDYAERIERGDEIHTIFAATVRQADGTHRSHMHNFGNPGFCDALTWQLLKHSMFESFRALSHEFPKVN